MIRGVASHPQHGRREAASPREGVLWDYPLNLHRRLLAAFFATLAPGAVATLLLRGESDPVGSVVHLVPLALSIVAALYLAGMIGVAERPLPRLRLDGLFAAIGASCLAVGAGYLALPDQAPPARLSCAAPAVAALFVYVRRRWQVTRGRAASLPAAVVAGSPEAAERAMARLRSVHGIEPRAVILPPRAPNRGGTRLAATLDADALDTLRRERVRILVVADALPSHLLAVLPHGAGAGCLVESLPDLVARARGRVPLDGGDELGTLVRLSRRARPRPAERAMDLLMGGVLLLLSLPAWLVVIPLVKLASPGPVFYRQTRVGRWGRPFTIVKFRTMRMDAERESGPVWSPLSDARIHRIGRVLRATHLDELPQLWNVLRGDMSLVGPRPERPCFVSLLSERIPLYAARHAVRPGLTGWAQIRYPYGASEEDAREKLAYDLFYVLNRSLAFYFAILLETARVLILRRSR
jgi:lipopolysaccharide/colanic/teichoic acid biosynthesis glycosyltransferase